jgi:hypothetical protein
LTDTNIATPSGGQLAIYDGTDSWDNKTVTGDVTITSAGATTIANSAVTLAKQANIATASFIGRNSASTGVQEVLSVATVQSMLGVDNEALEDKVAGMSTAGAQTGITVSYDDTNGELDYAVDPTNLTWTGASHTLNSSTGDNVIIPEAIPAGNSGLLSGADKTLLDSLETNADVTDATNVEAAGAVMEGDTTTASMSFVIDEDNMVSDLDTKVPTQQSVKAYVDGRVSSQVNYRGSFDPTAATGSGLPDLDAKTDTVIGDMYTVTVASTYNFTTGSVDLEIGDVLIAEATGTLNNSSQWTVVNKNLDAGSIKTSYESNSDTNAYTNAEVTKVGHISVTQAVNLDTMESNISNNNAKLTNVSTNLSYTAAAGQGTVVSSDGDNAVLPVANTTNAGLLEPADWDNLQNLSNTNTGDNVLLSQAEVENSASTAVGVVTGQRLHQAINSATIDGGTF